MRVRQYIISTYQGKVIITIHVYSYVNVRSF